MKNGKNLDYCEVYDASKKIIFGQCLNAGFRDEMIAFAKKQAETGIRCKVFKRTPKKDICIFSNFNG
jgi:hypothetical protein